MSEWRCNALGQVEAQMQIDAAHREWAGRVQKADATTAEMIERCRVAEEIAAGEAKAHAALLARLAAPVVCKTCWDCERLVLCYSFIRAY